VGIGIGIAAIVAVFGISASSKADLLAQIDSLGTNLLVVQAGNTLSGEQARLPVDAPAMVRRIKPVESAAAASQLDADVYRNEYDHTANGIAVLATEPGLLETLQGTMAQGRFLDDGSATLPTVVLGAVAAQRLAIGDVAAAPAVTIAGKRFAVIGILDSLPRTRRHIGLQFLVESVTLTTIVGAGGAGVGALITYAYAHHQQWTVSVPMGILAVAVLLGVLARLYPAVRAATMNPADAVRPTG
jgi:ABC-type antimicrobial peptide transport system permease subunit